MVVAEVLVLVVLAELECIAVADMSADAERISVAELDCIAVAMVSFHVRDCAMAVLPAANSYPITFQKQLEPIRLRNPFGYDATSVLEL